jgi:hypothetical protein
LENVELDVAPYTDPNSPPLLWMPTWDGCRSMTAAWACAVLSDEELPARVYALSA